MRRFVIAWNLDPSHVFYQSPSSACDGETHLMFDGAADVFFRHIFIAVAMVQFNPIIDG